MPTVIDSRTTLDDITLRARTIKADLRERIHAERHRRSRADRRAAEADLTTIALEVPDIADAECVATHVSTPTAPSTRLLRRALRRGGVRVLVPVVTGSGRLDWYEDVDGHRPLGGRHPGQAERRIGPEGIREAQAVIVPALAVDTLGNRLGTGNGFFDRALRLVDRSVPVFAVVHDGEVLDAAVEPVPTEPHDVPVDAIITPQRCLWLLSARRG